MGEFVDSVRTISLGQSLSRDVGDIVDVILEGGPTSFPVEQRFRQLPVSEVKVKVPYLGGYEHFERDPAALNDDPPAIVFRWTGRTRIAE